MRRAMAALHRLPWWSRTIWAEGAIPEEDQRVAGLIRYTLPVIDIILIIFGVVSVVGGFPVIAQIASPYASVLFGVLISASACAAFISLAFRIHRLEVVTKIILVSVIAVYPAFLLLGATFNIGRLAVGVLCASVIPVLLWRLRDLGRQKGLDD